MLKSKKVMFGKYKKVFKFDKKLTLLHDFWLHFWKWKRNYKVIIIIQNKPKKKKISPTLIKHKNWTQKPKICITQLT